MSDNMKAAVKAMGFEPDTIINLLDEPKTPNDRGRDYQRHVAIEWEGGVLWLNMFDFAGPEYEGDKPHYCIDVRQINSAGKEKGLGVMAMARNFQRMGVIDAGEGYKGESQPQGHGWNGGYVVALMTDPDGQETHTSDPKE